MKKLWLNIDKLDPMGPMQYNEELRQLILDKGTKAIEKLPLKLDPKKAHRCENIHLLHVPSGKVSAYSSYAYKYDEEQRKQAKIDGYLTVFNGFAQGKIPREYLDDFMWLYCTEENNKIGEYTEFKNKKDRETYIKEKK